MGEGCFVQSGAAFGEQAVRGLLYFVLHSREKDRTIKPWRDRGQDFNYDLACSEFQGASRPIQASIQSDWQARNIEPRIDLGNAMAVFRRSAWRAARAFGEKEDLASTTDTDLLVGSTYNFDEGPRTRLPVNRNIPQFEQVPTEKRDEGKFAFENKARIAEYTQERECFPNGLVFRCNQ